MTTTRNATKRIGAKNLSHAASNGQAQRFLIASQYSDDQKIGSIKVGDLAAIAIVYAANARAAIGRFRKQYPGEAKLDIEAFDYNSRESKIILDATIKSFNKHMREPGEEAVTVFDLELRYAVENERYKERKLRAERKRRERVKANRIAAKVSGDEGFDYDHLVTEYVDSHGKNAERLGVETVSASNVRRSKAAAIKDAEKFLAAKKTAKKSITKSKDLDPAKKKAADRVTRSRAKVTAKTTKKKATKKAAKKKTTKKVTKKKVSAKKK